VAYKAKVQLFDKLPIPPFHIIFTQSERIIMGLVYQLQLTGELENAYKLADRHGGLPLPGPWNSKTLATKKRYFPYGQYDDEDAMYILRMMTDESEMIPLDQTPWIDLIHVGEHAAHVSDVLGSIRPLLIDSCRRESTQLIQTMITISKTTQAKRAKTFTLNQTMVERICILTSILTLATSSTRQTPIAPTR
jgi:hypothetical protein